MVLIRRVVATVAGCALVACSSPRDGVAGGQSSGEKPVVIATTSIWADITSNILCGLPVQSLMPPGADPHTYEPSLRDRESVDRADVIVANGGGLEDSIADLLDASPGVVIEITSAVRTVADDPHIWQNPILAAEGFDAIVAATDPLGLDDCAAAYSLELQALDAEIIELLEPVRQDDRVMVTSHDSLSYFADRYGIEVVGTVIPSTNTLAATNAADLAVLADLIEERGVRSIFTEQLESSADADALADRLDVDVVALVTDALTDEPETDTYVEMMRSNATKIATALSP